MPQDIYIGLDGGGTKSKLVMRDAAGNLLGSGRAGPANICLSVEVALRSLAEALEQALDAAKIKLHPEEHRLHLGLGLAGTEMQPARHEFLARLPHFATVRLESDAYAACLGAHEGQDGAILIIGTGIVGYRVALKQEKRVSGWGFPHDDVGGGAWLGLHALRYTLEWLDGRRDSSVFLDAIYAAFQSNVMTLIAWANQATALEYATLAPIFTHFLVQGDRWAIELAQRSGAALSLVITALLTEHPTLPLCLFGGLASFIEPYLQTKNVINIVPRKQDATEGALLLVRNTVKKLNVFQL